MRNAPPDKYNVAWFKLAECVSRGEKERALGVYRLLAHSLHDSAFARQLQGDILLAFNDVTGAIEHYKTAARVYQLEERYLEAAAVYEHLLVLLIDKGDCLAKLVELHGLLGNTAKVSQHASELFALLLANNLSDEALSIVEQLDEQLPGKELVTIRQQLVLALLNSSTLYEQAVMPHVCKVIDHLLQVTDTQALQRFLTSLQALHEPCYEQACAYVHKIEQ